MGNDGSGLAFVDISNSHDHGTDYVSTSNDNVLSGDVSVGGDLDVTGTVTVGTLDLSSAASATYVLNNAAGFADDTDYGIELDNAGGASQNLFYHHDDDNDSGGSRWIMGETGSEKNISTIRYNAGNAPGTAAGIIGDIWMDTSNQDAYICIDTVDA